MVLRVQFCILASCCLSPMRINSVLEVLSVRDRGANFAKILSIMNERA